MLDLKIIRENPDVVKDNIKKRNLKLHLDDFLSLDKEKLGFIVKVDELRAIRNKVSKEIPSLPNEEKQGKIIEMKQLGEDLKILEESQKENLEKWNALYYQIPNVLDDTAAIGDTDEDNVLESKFLEPTSFDFEAQPHYEIGEKKGWIDVEKGSEVSGARFWYLKGDLVLLQFALINYAMSVLTSKGFNPILPPVLVREKAMFGTGFFPAGEDGLYRVNPDEDDLHLVGTSEVPVTSYHSDETLDLDQPKMYAAYSSCFRREAGSAGKDTRGILRGHQFDKIEMVTFCKADESQKMHDFMIGVEEEIWQGLEIPYQKVNVCSGDLGNPAMKKFDLEAWMPGQKKYREVTSCSNVGEYQTRRLGIKYKDENGKSQFAHTLNGTVIAMSRCMIAIIENYQTTEGDVRVPDVLIPFMGGKKVI
ncbi:serine--tRNA ligase [Candidatus Gracilibacteria bacterium 28_42_T64]|nr:serine--tRNA ligase [Candidatus Gracilibacteria bacterium 28_42_T64]